jgi:hypothetical protein
MTSTLVRKAYASQLSSLKYIRSGGFVNSIFVLSENEYAQ